MVSAYRNRSGRKLRDAFRGLVASGPVSAAVRLSLAAAVLACSACLLAADDGRKAEVEPPGRSFFGLGEFFKRDRSPGGSAAPASRNRFLARARLLLNEARQLEEAGQAEAALEMARRAESVIRAAQLTAGVRWPDSEESPGQFIAALKQRTGLIDESRPEPGSVVEEPATRRTDPELIAIPEEMSATRREPVVKSEVEVTGQHAGSRSPQAVESALGIHRNLVLDWGSRASGTGIELTGGVQKETPAERVIQSSDELDESSLLFQQLGELESPESPGPAPPLTIPGLIDRPDEIDDHHVAPIPTRPTDSVSGSPSNPVNTTIPVVPDPSDGTPAIVDKPAARPDVIAEPANRSAAEPSVYDAAPRLLTQSDSSSSRVDSEERETSVWELAAAQLVSTFLGVVLAAGLFLLVRAAASKFFGTRLGVTFQFGRPTKAAAGVSSGGDSTGVVPFQLSNAGEPLPVEVSQASQPKRAGGVAHLEDFPFRIVGANAKQDEEFSEGQGTQSAESSILKTVFESNLALMDNLDKSKESAA